MLKLNIIPLLGHHGVTMQFDNVKTFDDASFNEAEKEFYGGIANDTVTVIIWLPDKNTRRAGDDPQSFVWSFELKYGWGLKQFETGGTDEFPLQEFIYISRKLSYGEKQILIHQLQNFKIGIVHPKK